MANELANFADGIIIPQLSLTDFLGNGDDFETPITKINKELLQYIHNIKVAHLNAVSIPKHRDEVSRVLSLTQFDVFGVSETSIKPGTPKNLYQIPGYKLIRADRTHTTKGGVGIYFRDIYQPKKIQIQYDNLQPEMIFAEVEINRCKIAVGVIYKTPLTSYTVYAEIQEILAFITTKYSHVILLGDYNIDMLKNNRESDFFKNVILEPFSLHQMIREPTRITSATATLIDHITVTSPEHVKLTGVADFPGISDHCMVYMSYNIKKPKFKPVKITRRDFKNFDKNVFIREMDRAPWGNILTIDDSNQELNIDDKVTIVENIFREHIDKHAPLKEIIVKKPINSSWMTDEILSLMDTRDKYKNMYNRYKENFFFNRYKELRNEVNHKIRRAKIDEFNKTINDKVKESKTFHNALKKHNVVSSNKNKEDSCNFSPETLNETFTANNNATVDFEKIANTVNRINRKMKKGGCFKFQEVTDRDIIDTVKTLKSNSCGVDEISAFFVKLSINQSAAAIADIVNTSFRYNKFPERWKKAVIIAIPKTELPLTPADYRPISLLSVLSKIIEKLAAKQIIQYLTQHKLFDECQSGYRKCHSPGTALLEITDYIFQGLDNSEIAILVLLDYSRAFDCANHDIILAKLKSIGFSNCALNWIHSYLTDRLQRVKTQSGNSNWIKLLNGVPQGSILGPLLFTILLMDIKDSIKHCKFHLYADDTQIFIRGNLGEILAMIARVNADLNSINMFSEANNLTLNIKKCKYIIIGSPFKIRELRDINIPQIIIDNKPLKRETELYDLGVLIDENLSWEKHINNSISKAYGKLRTAYRAKNFLTKESKTNVVEYYVLSQLNYCNILMQNITQKLSTKIQKLQNACTRFIFGLRKFDHISGHFRQLKVLNMANRKTLHSATFMHKIVNKKAPTYLCSKIRYRNAFHRHNTRGNTKIHIPNYNNSFGRDRFFRKIAQEYNNILDRAGFDSNLSIENFKKKLKASLLEGQ